MAFSHSPNLYILYLIIFKNTIQLVLFFYFVPSLSKIISDNLIQKLQSLKVLKIPYKKLNDSKIVKNFKQFIFKKKTYPSAKECWNSGYFNF